MLVGHPFDLVKVRMQTGGGGSNSVASIMTKTFAQDGVSGLYRGVSAPLVAVAPIFAVNFWGYDILLLRLPLTTNLTTTPHSNI